MNLRQHPESAPVLHDTAMKNSMIRSAQFPMRGRLRHRPLLALTGAAVLLLLASTLGASAGPEQQRVLDALRSGQPPGLALSTLPGADTRSAPMATPAVAKNRAPASITDLDALEGRLHLDQAALEAVEERLAAQQGNAGLLAHARAVHRPMRAALAAALAEVAALRAREARAAEIQGNAILAPWINPPVEAARMLGVRALPHQWVALPPRALPAATGTGPTFARTDAVPGGAEALADAAGDKNLPGVRAAAQARGHEYPALFDLVRSEIRTDWYPGSQKNPDEVLRTGSGNHVDQARLLIALLRASGAPAQFVHARLSLELAQLQQWTNQPDAAAIARLFTRAGLAHEPIVSGGSIRGFRFEQVVVSAFVPYDNYRGVSAETTGKAWIPLAPAIKPHALRSGRDLLAEAGVTADATWNAWLSGAGTEAPLDRIRQQVGAFLATQATPASIDAVVRARAVDADPVGLLPASLPAVWEGLIAESVALPVAAPMLEIELGSERLAALPVDQLAGRRLTLSWQAARPEDQNLIDALGGLAQTPAYLVRLRARLMLDGEPIASSRADFTPGHLAALQLTHRWLDLSQTYAQQVRVGAYLAIGQGVQGNNTPVPATTLDGEFAAADYLAQFAARYLEAWARDESELAALADLELLRPWPALALVSLEQELTTIQGQPQFLRFKGVSLDALARPLSALGTEASIRRFLALNALQGSVLEHRVFADQWAVHAVSADQLLRMAGADGRWSQAAGVLDASVVLPEAIETELNAHLALGRRIDTVRQPLTVETWTGAAWRVEDPDTGDSGYFISGGYAGGTTTTAPPDWLLRYLVETFGAPYSPTPNPDPAAAFFLDVVSTTNAQVAEVGQETELPLAVRVTDRDYRPVVNATVRFIRTYGDGTLRTMAGDASGAVVEAQTDQFGVARVRAEPNVQIRYGLSVFLDSTDEHASLLSLNSVTAVVPESAAGVVVARAPITYYGKPGPAVRLATVRAPTEIDTQGFLNAAPGVFAGAWWVVALDAHDNWISNLPIEFRAEERSATACTLPPQAIRPPEFFREGQCALSPLPRLGQCAQTTLTLNSSVTTASPAFVIQGEKRGALYRLIASHGGLSTHWELANACASSDWAVSWPHQDRFGNLIEAATLDQPLGYRRRFSFYRIEADQMALFDPPGDLRVEEGGPQGLVAPLRIEGFGEQSTTYQGGNIPERQPIVFRQNGPLNGVTVGGFYTIDFGLNEVLPAQISLDAEGRPIAPIVAKIHWQRPAPLAGLEPTDRNYNYPIRPTLVIYRNDTRWLTWEAPNQPEFLEQSGTAEIGIPPLFEFDPAQDYTLELALHDASPAALRAPRVPLNFGQSVLAGYDLIGAQPIGPFGMTGRFPRKLLMSSRVDAGNNVICATEDRFAFTLNAEARVTIRARPIRANGRPGTHAFVLFDQPAVAAGTHEFPMPSDRLPEGVYQFEIDTTHLGTNEFQQVLVALNNEQTRVDTMALAHPIVKNVDLHNGHLTIARQDAAIGGRGPGLAFERTYSSDGPRSGRVGILGYGWRSNLESRVMPGMCGEVWVIGAEGGAQRFQETGVDPDGTRRHRALAGYHGTLIGRGSTYDFYSVNGTRYAFVLEGDTYELRTIADPSGNQVRYQYGSDNPLTRRVVTQLLDDAGRSLSFRYRTLQVTGEDPALVLEELTGPLGLKVQYDYNALGHLVEAKRIGAGACGPQRCERYEYADRGQVEYPTNVPPEERGVFRFRNGLSAIINIPDGAATRYTYRPLQLIMQTGGPSGVVREFPGVAVAEITEPDAGVWSFDYGPATYTFQDSTRVVTNGRRFETTYRLNGFGAAISVTDPAGTRTTTWNLEHRKPEREVDAMLTVTESTYDAHGNTLTQTRTRDGITVSQTWTYHPPESFTVPIKNRIATWTDGRGHVEQREYTPTGLMRSRTRGGYTESMDHADNGDLLVHRDFRNHAEVFTYDAFGYRLTHRNAEDETVITRHDARGRLVETTSPLRSVTSMQYDEADRLIRTVLPPAPTTAEISTEYIDAERRVIARDELNRPTIRLFDPMGRLLSETNAKDDSATFTYDKNGNMLTRSNFRGHETTFTYDGADRMLTRSEPLGRETVYTYTPTGLLESETTTRAGEAVRRETRYRYEHPSDKPTHIRRWIEGDSWAEERFIRDGNGNASTTIDAEQRETVEIRDPFDRVVRIETPLVSPTIIVRDGNGNPTLETRGGVERSWSYDRVNRMVSATDGNNKTTLTEYDDHGDVVLITDANEHTTRQEYDARRRLKAVTDARRYRTHFVLDPVGNRIEEHHPNDRIIVHTYDVLNRRTRSTDNLDGPETPIDEVDYDADGHVTFRSDARGADTILIVNELGQETEVRAPLGRTTLRTFDAFGNVLTERTPAGFTTRHAYDGLGRRTLTELPEGSGALQPRRWTYDKVGNVLTSTDSNGNTTTHRYDALNRRERTIHPDAQDGGVDEVFVYDDRSDLETATDRKGVLSRFTYDNEHRRTSVTRAEQLVESVVYDPVGNRLELRNARNHVTRWRYTPTNLVEEMTQVLETGDAVWFHTYTPTGKLQSVLDPASVLTEYTYDLRDRETERRIPGINGPEIHQQRYDLNGNRTKRILPKATEWTYVYDAANRLESVESDIGHVTSFGYSLDDVLVSVTDANLHVSERTPDALGRVKAFTYPATDTCAEPACRTQQQLFDGEGLVRTVIQPNGATRTRTPDALNRIRTESAVLSGQGSLDETRTYDPNGNVLTRTLVGEADQLGQGGLTRQIAREYDPRDRMIRDEVSLSGGTALFAGLGDFRATQTFVPDAAGNRINRRDAANVLETATFDAADRPLTNSSAEGAVSIVWNRDGTMHARQHGNGTEAVYRYDPAKRVTGIDYRRGGVSTLSLSYTYDPNGNRTDEHRVEQGLPGQGPRTVHTQYGFDPDDRLVSETVTVTPADPLLPDTRTVWTLDGVGNRQTETVTRLSDQTVLNQKTFVYSERDQLESMTDAVTGLQVVYGYDVNGNRTQRTVTRQGQPVSQVTYRFDARDRMVGAVPNAPNPGNTPSVRYLYDGEDRMLARVEIPWSNGTPNPAQARLTIQVSEGQQLLHEAEPRAGSTPHATGLRLTDSYRRTGALDRHVRYAAEGQGGGSGDPQADVRTYQTDALGSPLVLTDSQGDAISSTKLDAWGNPVQQTADGQSQAPGQSGDPQTNPNFTGQAALLSNDQQTIGFTGYQKDAATGLYYANARFYDPLVGVFGASDPWSGDPSRPVTLNKYLYANGNPVVFVDPTGRSSCGMGDMVECALLNGDLQGAQEHSRAQAISSEFTAGAIWESVRTAARTGWQLAELGADNLIATHVPGDPFGAKARFQKRSEALSHSALRGVVSVAADPVGVASDSYNAKKDDWSNAWTRTSEAWEQGRYFESGGHFSGPAQEMAGSLLGALGLGKTIAGAGTKAVVKNADMDVRTLELDLQLQHAATRSEVSPQKVVEAPTGESTLVSNAGTANQRLLSGIEGVVAGGSSRVLGQNLLREMGVSGNQKWTGYQAQHVIPLELAENQVLQKVGINLDHESNGIFLRAPADGTISPMARHMGPHPGYTDAIEAQLNAMDISLPADQLQLKVYDLQQKARFLQQHGLPVRPRDGGTYDLWMRWLDK